MSKNKNTQVSNEKRQNLIRLVMEEGENIVNAAVTLQIKYHTAWKIVKNFQFTGNSNKKFKGGSEKSVATPEVLGKIEEFIEINPDLTYAEIKQKLKQVFTDNFTISLATICRCLQSLQITRKLAHRELDRVNDPGKIILRKDYSIWFNNFFDNEFSKAIFIDESSFNLHLKRSYARSRKGTRAIVTVPTVKGRSVSLIGSMMMNGMGYCKTISNSSVNSQIFAEYLRELCVWLRDVARVEGTCLILDNARVHRRQDIENITSQYSFTFQFLSPYSYMLNPIENGFSKIKSGLRSRLRLGEAGLLSEMIMAEVGRVSPNDCAGYFRYVLRNITNCAAEIPYTHQ